MDRDLRTIMRSFWSGRLEQEAALRALERAGARRAARFNAADEAIRRAFIDQLDFAEVHLHPGSLGGAIQARLLLQGPPIPRELVRTVEAALAQWTTFGGDAAWRVRHHVAEAEDFDDERIERHAGLDVPVVWSAHRRHQSDLTTCTVWFPSRYEMLQDGHGDPSDTRVVVSATLKERAEVIETLCEEMPWATIVSWQVTEGRRPERRLVQQPKEEGEWPRESNRVHVR